MPTGVTGRTGFGGIAIVGGVSAPAVSTGSWVSPAHVRSIGSPSTILNTWKDLVWSGANVTGGSLFMHILDAANDSAIITNLNLGDSPYTISGNALFNDKNLKVMASFQSGTSSTTPQLFFYNLAYEPNTLGNRAGALTAALSGGSWTI